MARKKEYTRLPGRRRYTFGHHTLWLGPDHLLAMATRMVVEEYQRFYYRDIQALVMRQLTGWKIVLAISGFLTAVFLLMALTMDMGWNIFWGIMCALAAVVFVHQVFFGTNCECHLVTAVQTVKLPSLYRRRFAEKTLRRIRPLIDQAQGVLSPAEIRAQAPLPAAPEENARAGEPASPRPILNTNWHAAMSALLLANALIINLVIFYTNAGVLVLGATLFMVFLITVIIALVRQQNRRVYPSLRRLTWINLAYAALGAGFGYLLYFYIIVQDPALLEQSMGTHWDFVQAFARLSVGQDPFLRISFLAAAIIEVILGMTGFLLITRHRRVYRP